MSNCLVFNLDELNSSIMGVLLIQFYPDPILRYTTYWIIVHMQCYIPDYLLALSAVTLGDWTALRQCIIPYLHHVSASYYTCLVIVPYLERDTASN